MSKELNGDDPSILRTRGFAAFRSEYSGRVSASIRRRVRRDEALVSDLTQDTFVKVFESQEQLRALTVRQELAWLFSIVGTVVAGHYRKEKIHRDALARLLPRAGGADPEFDHVDDREAAERLGVIAVLQQMKWMYRRPIELRYLEGHDYNTIGRLLDERPETVRMRVQRGLEEIRGLLGIDDRP